MDVFQGPERLDIGVVAVAWQQAGGLDRHVLQLDARMGHLGHERGLGHRHDRDARLIGPHQSHLEGRPLVRGRAREPAGDQQQGALGPEGRPPFGPAHREPAPGARGDQRADVTRAVAAFLGDTECRQGLHGQRRHQGTQRALVAGGKRPAHAIGRKAAEQGQRHRRRWLRGQGRPARPPLVHAVQRRDGGGGAQAMVQCRGDRVVWVHGRSIG